MISRAQVFILPVLCALARAYSECSDSMFDLKRTSILRFRDGRLTSQKIPQLQCVGSPHCDNPAAGLSSVECTNLRLGISPITKAFKYEATFRGPGFRISSLDMSCTGETVLNSCAHEGELIRQTLSKSPQVHAGWPTPRHRFRRAAVSSRSER
ncbi:uncharacterized protein LOC100903351 [Galendromus occidentalis]|uniref:Uncharacterized protein LOC100903351 n=1 Tax=Galendromus occidentalis TaxID=34638 RepID=A0AAJ6VVL2_9ACAR|nr:uncharacterized protein LOC100903351 [Galendromus occidentalis]